MKKQRDQMTVKILNISEDILGANKRKAAENHQRLKEQGVFCINLLASPGAGKTSLILKTIESIKEAYGLAVIEGDIASNIDAVKIERLGIPAYQINTGGGCHLDANMIRNALDNLAFEKVDLLFIENVGNLVCTADFALGEDKNVLLLSIPEGDDKPYKYPLIFSQVDLVLVNKIDVSPYFDFDLSAFREAVSQLNPEASIIPVSCKTGEGMELWLNWLQKNIR